MYAIRYMLSDNVDAVPVIDDAGQVVGVVTRGALAGVLDDVFRTAPGLAATSEDDHPLPVRQAFRHS